ncbi:hypothetical protein, partial [Nocardioides malaquae]|uniref:hypothetical protein n=1 Tax=Nocardioides malaquae TaxID=2773426 RepID=UPI001D0D7A6E
VKGPIHDNDFQPQPRPFAGRGWSWSRIDFPDILGAELYVSVGVGVVDGCGQPNLSLVPKISYRAFVAIVVLPN